MQNELGQRGENLFAIIITRFYGRNKPIFRPQFLGDKWPTSDFIVELLDTSTTFTPYFFVQVRTTRQGYSKRKRLKVYVSAADMRRLAALPAPTYVVGIDDIMEEGYIISANGEHLKVLNGLSTQYPLNKNTQDKLWQEITHYWEQMSQSHPQMTSQFVEPEWMT